MTAASAVGVPTTFLGLIMCGSSAYISRLSSSSSSFSPVTTMSAIVICVGRPPEVTVVTTVVVVTIVTSSCGWSTNVTVFGEVGGDDGDLLLALTGAATWVACDGDCSRILSPASVSSSSGRFVSSSGIM